LGELIGGERRAAAPRAGCGTPRRSGGAEWKGSHRGLLESARASLAIKVAPTSPRRSFVTTAIGNVLANAANSPLSAKARAKPPAAIRGRIFAARPPTM